MAKRKIENPVKIRMTLSIGLGNVKQEDILEFDEADVPTDPKERDEWLDDEWKAWAWNYIDGGATIES